MKRHLLIVTFAIFLGIFAQPQTLSAYYPCEFTYPGQTGNCEGCGNLSPTDCHRDCVQGFYGYDCSQVKKITPVCVQNTTYYSTASCSCPAGTTQEFLIGGVGGFSCVSVCQMNFVYSYNRNYSDRCRCPADTMTLGVSTTNSTQLDSFKCVSRDQNPVPQPLPITYCELNRQYSFRIYPGETACTCPLNSTLVRPSYLTGTNTFTCVAPVTPAPIELCEINRSYFYNFSQIQCACPTDTYKMTQSSYGATGGNTFMCIYNYRPQPTPVVMQTCWNGIVIPNTSSCPAKPVCSYNQYWNGYSCTDYYQQYYPVIQPAIDYQDMYDDQSYYYDQPSYTSYGWPEVDWSGVRRPYFNR
jgi:hypothetical protein